MNKIKVVKITGCALKDLFTKGIVRNIKTIKGLDGDETLVNTIFHSEGNTVELWFVKNTWDVTPFEEVNIVMEAQ